MLRRRRKMGMTQQTQTLRFPSAAGLVPSGGAPGGGTAAEEQSRVPSEPIPETTLWMIAIRDQRDRSAFAKLFDHFAPRLKAMLMRSGLRDGSAEDVVQDVMLAVWNKAAQFDPHRAEASGWIYRIARNRHIDLVRRRSAVEADELIEPEGSEPDAAQILGLEQERRRLRLALEKLSPDQSGMIRKAFLEEMAHSEIGQLTGLPLGTIKSRIRLGLERLRRDLTDLRQP
jgi:RNA polymerase sigma-70 factor (ECF subfamily)